MTNQDIEKRLASLERRWRDAKIAGVVIGIALVTFFGITWQSIPSKVEESLKGKAVKTAEKEAQSHAAEAKTALSKAEESAERIEKIKSEYADKLKELEEAGPIFVAGSVQFDGRKKKTYGNRSFNSNRLKGGFYKISFDQPFPKIPVVIATSHSETDPHENPGGSDARVSKITVDGFQVEGQHNQDNAPGDIGFEFIAISSRK